ncbi:hypothetical protein K435DRAFT_932898 [Dendrothele bispora CBS 962.96]|uniref:Uncharacterized protein n=1 Tax=Dendrothele bispora (strain CBS 962.96) TaxID=1314807 RepID=A0A4S8L2M0_DENBC|nr:hypothetical protein K435DRAFT_932898 [Dendrothele bispora CBS 962.96]
MTRPFLSPLAQVSSKKFAIVILDLRFNTRVIARPTRDSGIKGFRIVLDFGMWHTIQNSPEYVQHDKAARSRVVDGFNTNNAIKSVQRQFGAMGPVNLKNYWTLERWLLICEMDYFFSMKQCTDRSPKTGNGKIQIATICDFSSMRTRLTDKKFMQKHQRKRQRWMTGRAQSTQTDTTPEDYTLGTIENWNI